MLLIRLVRKNDLVGHSSWFPEVFCYLCINLTVLPFFVEVMSANSFYEDVSRLGLEPIIDGLSEADWLDQETEMLRQNGVSEPRLVAERTLQALLHPELCTPYDEIRESLFGE